MKKDGKIIELSAEELENGCKKKVFIDGEFVEVVIPKNSKENSKIAVEVEDKNGKKKKIVLFLCLLAKPVITKGDNLPEDDYGMKPRKKGMKYENIKKDKFPKKAVFGGTAGIAIIAIVSLLIFLPKSNDSTNNDDQKKEKKQKVICDYLYNENFDNIWIPSQSFHYEFLFSKDGNTIESIQISENFKYNQGSLNERKVYKGNSYSVIPGGTDQEIKKTYFSSCDDCVVENGIMKYSHTEDVNEFLNNSNIRNDKNKNLKENLSDTFNIDSSCEEGFYPFIPYIDTQMEYCPMDNFKSSCVIEDVE